MMARSSGASRVPRYFSKGEVIAEPLFAVPPIAPAFSFQRKTSRPFRRVAHDPCELGKIARSLQYLGHDFIVHGKHDRVSRCFEVEHCVPEQIPAESMLCVLHPQAAV